MALIQVMMMSGPVDRGMSSFDVARMNVELKDLIGARAQKSYQPHYEQIVLRIKKTGSPPMDLVIVRGKRAYISKRDRAMPQNPSPFAMTMRKQLSNARLVSVQQIGFDRILWLEFEHGRGKVSLIIELFRDGNVILVGEEGRIIQPLTSAAYRSRILKRGEVYSPPPASMDPRTLGHEELFNMFREADQDLEKTLAGRANLGRSYANLVCRLADINPRSSVRDLEEGHKVLITDSIKELIHQANSQTEASVWIESGNPEKRSYSPFSHPPSEDAKREPFQTLSGAIDAIYGDYDSGAFQRRVNEKISEEVGEPEGDKLSRRAEQQKKGIEAFTEEARLLQKSGSAMLQSWAHLESIRSQLKESISKDGWGSTVSTFKASKWVSKIDPSKKTALVYLQNEHGLPETEVEIQIDKTIHQSSQVYFERAKILKSKSEGAKKAFEETQREQKKVDKKMRKDKALGRVATGNRTRKYWFERHRWAIIGKGRIMVGGRDSKGNDAIVKRHLTKGDLYFHADLHGAPSCALKKLDRLHLAENSGKISEDLPQLIIAQTTEDSPEDLYFLPDHEKLEAATIAACWSRAWGAGSAAATAFHVRPSQVSKATESGESLGRGSFVVRGTRGWHRGLTMRMAIGLATVNGIPIPIPGSVEAVSEVCLRWVEVLPGRVKKEKIASLISKSTGLNHDEVLSSLPPGSCDLKDNGLLRL